MLFRAPMNRNEAVTYLRELLIQCNDLSPNAVSFEQPKNGESIGYNVHIRGSMHQSDKEIVRNIAKKHSLTVKENEDGVIVYRAK